MRIFRYVDEQNKQKMGVLSDEGMIYSLSQPDFFALINESRIQNKSLLDFITIETMNKLPLPLNFEHLKLITPIQAPEVWAAGVTYAKSKAARNYEATSGKLDRTTFYDKVYDAERPEIFFKATPSRTVGPNQDVFLRSDSNWQIPEPELGLVLDRNGEIVGFTIGNDMSCRDIEGENPLYLPQAKMWKNSCSIGPTIRLSDTVSNPYNLVISCHIYRDGIKVFEGSANTSQLKRKFTELVEYLLRDNEILDGTVLLTGTCIVPPNEFTLLDKDIIEIEITEIGTLVNSVKAIAKEISSK